MEKPMSFDLFLYVGGYWANNDMYHGGEVHEVGKMVSDDFSLKSVCMLIVDLIGYDENMRKVSRFPPETPGKKEDIDDDEIMRKVVLYAVGAGAMTLFVVREDDPYIGRRVDTDVGCLSEDDTPLEQESSSSESDDEDEDNDNDAIVGEFDEQNDSSSDNENDAIDVVYESKYRKFMLGQQYKTIQSFKNAITRYAVRKKRDIKLEKSDSTRVVAICSDKKCPWRISASINSSSSRVVVRAFKDEHDCTWQGKVSLLTNARIAELYIEEFRINPDISAKQLQKKLLKRNINVPETVCERTRLRCLQTFDEEQAESFARLFDYIVILKKTNPGSTVECEVFVFLKGIRLSGWDTRFFESDKN